MEMVDIVFNIIIIIIIIGWSVRRIFPMVSFRNGSSSLNIIFSMLYVFLKKKRKIIKRFLHIFLAIPYIFFKK